MTVIAQQCQQHPNRVAVVASDAVLTYRELGTRVAALAHRLAESGVAPDSLVAICMPRGADELTAVLAVLTLRAAYVPLDSSQPASRLAMIIADARPDVLLTQPGHALPLEHTFPTMFVGSSGDSGGISEEATWAPHGAPESLAYVLFTSGSTGRPKGVEIPRRAVSNLVAAMRHTPGLRQSDVLLAVATTMFDMSVLDLFGPLSVGAAIRIIDPDTVRDGRRLRKIIDHESVSVMQATPTMWHMLIDAGWAGDGRLRILVGGEPLSPNLARQLSSRGEVWNMYGPTETTVWSTCKRIDDPDDITIGRPIDNTEVHVLDGNRRILPPGVMGELCIGGSGLARGYRGRADLTGDRFIQNPAGPPGDRIYRTGDLVRLRSDGELEYFGRADHQVKIRGFRIELGEVEHAIGGLEGVGRAVVIKWEPTDGHPMLVAYVVPTAGAGFDPSRLSRLLRDRLPSYMVPGRFIEMASLPLTPNRKVDRAALPDPAESTAWPARGRRTSPRTETEQTLLLVWSDVLNRSNISIEDDFFDLGGQSILAVKICDRIHKGLQVDLPVSTLLDRRTIEELAAHIDDLRNGSTSQEWSSVVPIQPNGVLPPIFCVSGIGGNPMTFLDLADALGPRQPLYGLQHSGVDGRRHPYESVEAMAQDFLDDIRSVQANGPYILAGYSGGGLAAYEIAQRLATAGEQIRLLILFDTARPGLGGWSLRQRRQAHWANLKAGGLGYLAERVAGKITGFIEDCSMRVRARLAAYAPYRFRLPAVEMAGRRAACAYVPQPYPGDVLLFQSDPEIGFERGIPAKQDESNGWRDLVGGDLEVVAVHAGHLGILEGAAARFVASELNRAVMPKAQERIGEGS